MCWGAGPTLFFVAVESAVIAYLWHRNQLYDRDNVAFHSILLLQEIIQLLIWLSDPPPYPGPGGESLYNCSAANKGLSWLVAVTIWGVPYWWGHVATKAIAVPKEKFLPPGLAISRTKPYVTFDTGPGAQLKTYNTILRAQKRWAARFVVWMTCAMTGSRVLGLSLVGGKWPACTTAGPWGHQVWGPSVLVPIGVPARLLLAVTYVALCGTAIKLWARESYAIHVCLVGGSGSQTLVLLLLGIGWEAGAVWCFMASACCVGYLFEPYLFRRFGFAYRFGLNRTVFHVPRWVPGCGGRALPPMTSEWGVEQREARERAERERVNDPALWSDKDYRVFARKLAECVASGAAGARTFVAAVPGADPHARDPRDVVVGQLLQVVGAEPGPEADGGDHAPLPKGRPALLLHVFGHRDGGSVPAPNAAALHRREHVPLFTHGATRERRWADTGDLVGCAPAVVLVPLALSFQLLGVPEFDLLLDGSRMPEQTARKTWEALDHGAHWTFEMQQRRRDRAGGPNTVIAAADAGGRALFIASDAYVGKKGGYVFKKGRRGVGYYLDKCELERLSERAAGDPAAEGGMEAAGENEELDPLLPVVVR